jgi:hypothetical protein
MEVEADRNSADAEPLDQVVVNEILCRRPGAFRVECHDHRAVEAGPGQQPQLVAQIGQFELRRIRAEERARMRLERHRIGRGFALVRHIDGGGNHGPVAQMDAIEVAQRHRGALRDRAGGGGVANDGKACRHGYR